MSASSSIWKVADISMLLREDILTWRVPARTEIKSDKWLNVNSALWRSPSLALRTATTRANGRRKKLYPAFLRGDTPNAQARIMADGFPGCSGRHLVLRVADGY
jgi:hypothetical protein